tara:strand:+ start:320 stop:571 length:252 start_codon:yes stop_codon:yes gene_type:complete
MKPIIIARQWVNTFRLRQSGRKLPEVHEVNYIPGAIKKLIVSARSSRIEKVEVAALTRRRLVLVRVEHWWSKAVPRVVMDSTI